MIRHVSIVGVMLVLSASTVSAQAPATESTELTVRAASADVHKFASIASAVVGQTTRGTVLEIRRNLGSWVEVPWAQGENGVGFVHVTSGTIAPRTPSSSAAVAAPAQAAALAPGAVSAVARANVAASPNQPVPRRSEYISLPSHVVGIGGRLSKSAPRFGASARAWWPNRLGLQLEVSNYPIESSGPAGQVRSFEFAPSALYALPNAVNNSFWLRPYVGGGGGIYHATLTSGISGADDGITKNGLGFQTFGGGEVTFAGAPQFALSADLAYRWSRIAFPGFEPRKIGFSVSGHWYVK